jgi:CheY-like chemotaxis protein
MSPLGNAAIQILVVEDDALTRLATRDRIEAAGFKVYEASHADEAIQSLESHPDHLYGCSHARFDGRREARSFRAREMASCQNYRHLRIYACHARPAAERQRIPWQALSARSVDTTYKVSCRRLMPLDKKGFATK